MDIRRPLDDKATGLMLVLCLVWAMQQIALKATAADIAPVFQLALRSGVAAMLVALLMVSRGERMPIAGSPWRPGLLAGVLFSLEFLLVGEALRHTSASHVVVFLYTAPIFAALGLHWRLPNERLGALQWLGIALAFSGIVIAFFGDGQTNTAGHGASLWGDFLALMAGVIWGATTVVIRCSRLSTAPATHTLLYQLGVAFVMLSAAAIASGQTHVNATPLVWASLGFQVLVVSFASFLAWFWLLRHYLASRLGVFTFLTPLLGILLGAWLLGEVIERSFVLGAVPVLAGIVLVSGHGWATARLRFGLAMAGSMLPAPAGKPDGSARGLADSVEPALEVAGFCRSNSAVTCSGHCTPGCRSHGPSGPCAPVSSELSTTAGGRPGVWWPALASWRCWRRRLSADGPRCRRPTTGRH